MEFFKNIDIKTTEAELCSQLSLKDLDSYSNDLFILEDPEEDKVQIGGIWGEFTLTRHLIAGGLRFALRECPNALAWTVTTGFPPEPNNVVIHLTINRKEKNREFVEELEEFLEDIAEGIKSVLTTKGVVFSHE